MHEILDPKKISTRKQGSVLTRLWRTILKETGAIANIEYLIDELVKKSGSMKSQKSLTKAQVKKNVVASDMTWSAFNQLIFGLLRVRKVRIDITLQYYNGTTTTHHTVYDDISSGMIDTADEEKKIGIELHHNNGATTQHIVYDKSNNNIVYTSEEKNKEIEVENKKEEK